MSKHYRMTLLASVLSLLACLLAIAPADAQSYADRLRNVAERAVRSEVEREVDRQARRVTRCAMGDTRCVQQAQRRGEQVEMVGAGQSSTADPGGDHPLVRPYAGSVPTRTEHRSFKAFDEYPRIIGHSPQRTAIIERVQGRVTLLQYENPKGRSALEIMRNYRDALVAQGYRVEFEMAPSSGPMASRQPRTKPENMRALFGDWRYMTGRIAYNGGTAFVTIGVGDGTNLHMTYVHVVETTDMDTGMAGSSGHGAAPVALTDASAMASGLERDGSIILGGLYFDTARATLRPESHHSLQQVAMLLRQQPQLRLLIVGHTDSTGAIAANQTLSQQRANSVRNALIGQGISAARLSTSGAGSSAPVADNNSESGRALNRRVELVRM